MGFVVEFWGWWWDNRDVEREDLSTVDKFESREITSLEHHGERGFGTCGLWCIMRVECVERLFQVRLNIVLL